eukprot:3564642-Prymnesium_polylepis.3
MRLFEGERSEVSPSCSTRRDLPRKVFLPRRVSAMRLRIYVLWVAVGVVWCGGSADGLVEVQMVWCGARTRGSERRVAGFFGGTDAWDGAHCRADRGDDRLGHKQEQEANPHVAQLAARDQYARVLQSEQPISPDEQSHHRGHDDDGRQVGQVVLNRNAGEVLELDDWVCVDCRAGCVRRMRAYKGARWRGRVPSGCLNCVG